MAANLTQILNLKVNFPQEFELFKKKKIMLTMVDTLILSAKIIKKNIKFVHIKPYNFMK